MNKKDILSNLQSDHQKLEKVVGQLTAGQKRQPILGEWALKEILAHIVAWDKELIKAMDDIQSGRIPWYGKPSFTDETGDRFNQKIIRMYGAKTLGQVVTEWQETYREKLTKVKSTSEEDFLKSNGSRWQDGTPMTIDSLFTYQYEGAGHEGGHAKQIQKHFRLT